MSLQDLLALAPVPGLDAVVTLLTATYQNIENIKVYKQQCADLSAQSISMLLALREGSEGLEGTKAAFLADELEPIFRRINRKVHDWGKWGPLKSFLQQSEMKEGIDRLQREINGAMMKFNIAMGMELKRGQYESLATQQRDKIEIREVLQMIVKSQTDMKALLSMQSSQPVEDIMEHLQTQLMDPEIPVQQEQSFREGLWFLHSETSKLPPLTDLSGQVTMDSNRAVAIGTYNDVFLGQWLDKERVALRLPRTLPDHPDMQKRFQREVTLWRQLEHPNVLPLFGIAYIDRHLYSVSPWMDNGTAIAFVQKYPQVNRLKLLSETAAGLEYLHSQGIVHGDLRGANVLISEDGVARLSDFGLSKFLEDCAAGGMTSSPNVNPRWYAPELIRQTAPISTGSDVWALSMTFLELLTGEQPFSGIPRDINVMREIDNGKTPSRPSGSECVIRGLNDAMWSLIKKCWKKPESRPTVQEIQQKLAEIRGESSPVPDKPGKGRKMSMLSLKSSSRPSTSGSSTSVKSSVSSRPKLQRAFSDDRIQEDDEISSLSMTNTPRAPPIRGSSSISSYSSTLSPIRGSGFNDSIHSDIFLEPRSPTSPNLRYSPSSIDSRPQLPRLDISDSPSSYPRSDTSATLPSRRTYSVGNNSIRMPSRSIISTDSGDLSGPLKDAVFDSACIVYTNSLGMVVAGTLEGLIERLINNFNLRRDMEYRDVMLTACIDFITPEDLFAILSRRFHEAEQSTDQHPEDRVAVQYNIFMVIMYWLQSRHLPVDSQLLWQMRTFTESAIRMKTASTMVDKARDLLQLINERPRQDMHDLSMTLSPGRRMLTAADISPRDLAIALTLLEGDRYRKIMPSDYLAHQRRQKGYNHVDGACSANNKIIHWVKQSVLHYDAVQSRADVMKFFINTAQECRKMRNFHSFLAISIALSSAPIERLKLTKNELSPKMRLKLEEIVQVQDPLSNHRRYRDQLNEVIDPEYRDNCIPWLALHLRELHSVLVQNSRVVEIDRRPLINFQRYVRFMDRVKEVFHYTPPDLERYRQQGQLAYLEYQLADVVLGDLADDRLTSRSLALEAGEARIHKNRTIEIQRLGFVAGPRRVNIR